MSSYRYCAPHCSGQPEFACSVPRGERRPSSTSHSTLLTTKEGSRVTRICRYRSAPAPVGDRAQERDGELLSKMQIVNDPVALTGRWPRPGPEPEVVLEATFGWYWAADLLEEMGAHVHLAHPLGNDWGNRRVKNDERDADDLVDLLRLGRLAEAWIAPPEVRELRELVRYRAKLVRLRSGLKAQVHAVMGKHGVFPTGWTCSGRAAPPSSTRSICRSATRGGWSRCGT